MLPKSGLIFAVALNSAVAHRPDDHIDNLAFAVHATLTGHGIGR